jgi:hypothetical protein
LGLPHPFVICTDPDLFHQQANNNKKLNFSTLLGLRNDLLPVSLKSDAVSSVSNKQKNFEEKR